MNPEPTIAPVDNPDERRYEIQVDGELVAFALGEARERGLAVLPFCPFVKAYIQRHREYVELVPADRRSA